MKISITLILMLIHLSIRTFAQTDEKIEVKAINRQFIKRKDTTYRFYAIIPEKPLKTRPDRVYHWYKADTILATAGGYDGRLLDGPFTVFYPDKNLEEEGIFRNGLRDGEWKSWYPGGKIRLIIHWDDGVRKGAFTEYDQEGRKIREGYYRKDLLSGDIKEYGADGKLSIIKYEDGQPVKPKEKAKPKADSTSKPGTPSDKKKKKKEADTGHGN